MRKLLLIVDPQNDFVNSKGSLYVPGAEKGIEAIIRYIKEHGEEITDIAITQDTHHKYHIAHPGFWYPQPKPFTQITPEDYRDGVYMAIMYPSTAEKPYDPFILQYLESLPGPLTIWPEHCLEGSWGWCFPDPLVEAIQNWEMNTRPHKSAEIYRKGMMPNFEAFSLFTSTPQLNWRPYADIDIFTGYPEIVICGFAGDICVANTVADMIASGLYDGKLVFFNEGMTPLNPDSAMMQVYKNAIKNHGAKEF